MAVRRLKDLTPLQRKVRRSSQYTKLMDTEIPEKRLSFIVPEMWYIVYEENLLKPKILLYAFRAELFANTYAQRNLGGKKYNVLSGKKLIEFGFDRAYNNLYSLKIHLTGNPNKTYDYPEGLSPQRRKTLRTMYRRNYRRLLVKMINYSKAL